MDKYYYFISQLPTLFFDKPSEITIEYFLNEAQKWLSARDYTTLSSVDLDDIALEKKRNRVQVLFRTFEFGVKHDIASWRKARREKQEYKTRSFPVSMIKEGNPLNVEKKLLQLRWDFIDTEEREHHFDLGFIVCYYLKLQIIHRLATFNKEKGEQIYKNLCEVTE